MAAHALSGALRLTWVTDHLEHVLNHSRSDEPTGTWTGLACPDHNLVIGTDVDHAALQSLAQGRIADLVWEAPAEFTTDHGQLCTAAIKGYQAGNGRAGEELWERAGAMWAGAWSANQEAIALMQQAGLTIFSTMKPQRWVIASFEHHSSAHGLARPHIHNIVTPALTTASAA